ncbi:MAG: hypothetical protein KGO94_12175 [Alphaproteobacteria bacterium]|nr:hypothetical protein [Alphaproteobacteria bacterium]
MQYIKFLGHRVRVPAHPLARALLGVLLVLGGLFSFLPILGVWMLPLGLIVLSVDSAVIRRGRRRASVKFGRWVVLRWPKLARALGFHVLQ